MTSLREHWAVIQGWDGICVVCKHDWAHDCSIGCTCIACAAEQQEMEQQEECEGEEQLCL